MDPIVISNSINGSCHVDLSITATDVVQVVKIGVLALQGGFREHVDMIKTIGIHHSNKYTIQVGEIKSVADIRKLQPDGIILPGGESTSMAIIASNQDENIFTYLKEYIKSGKMVWGTCAGSIMLSNHVDGQKIGGQSLIGGLDVLISRNYFGRQIDSFETKVKMNLCYDDGKVESLDQFEAVFIRAPAILKVHDVDNIKVIGDYTVTKKDGSQEKVITAVKQNNLLASVFHPELTKDTRFHHYFIKLVLDNKSNNKL